MSGWSGSWGGCRKRLFLPRDAACLAAGVTALIHWEINVNGVRASNCCADGDEDDAEQAHDGSRRVDFLNALNAAIVLVLLENIVVLATLRRGP